MVELLIVLTQLCSTQQCIVNTKLFPPVITICDENAVPNAKKFAEKYIRNEKGAIILRINRDVCPIT